MPRQRIDHGRIVYVMPDDFPQRLRRLKGESGLPWAEDCPPHRDLSLHRLALGRSRRAPPFPAPDGPAGPTSLAGKPLATFRATLERCISVLYGIVSDGIRQGNRNAIEIRRSKIDDLDSIGFPARFLAQELGRAYLLTVWTLPDEGQGETPAEVSPPHSRSLGKNAAQRQGGSNLPG